MQHRASFAAAVAPESAESARAIGGMGMIMTIITTTTHMRGASG